MIDDTEKALIDLYETAMLHGEAQANGVLPTQKQREQTVVLALTAIYEIGLECIGADEKLKHNANQFSVKTLNIETRNDLKASQRKAWAKACGVAVPASDIGDDNVN